MIKDRGNIKWTSLMLPEHVGMLREWAKEDTYEQRAVLDEQQLEDMDRIIGEMMEDRHLASIMHYENKRHHLLIGHIHYYDEMKKKLHVVDRFNAVHYIKLENISDVSRFTE